MRVFDCHIHIQPWEQLRPEARALMAGGRRDLARVEKVLSDPEELLRLMDEEGIERAALINYVAPEIIGFDSSVNGWVARFVRGHERRLVAVGSVNPRHEPDPAAATRRLADTGIRILKIHPPHQLFASNAYVSSDDGLRRLYATAEEIGLPVMIHTGTSVFPGARNRFADPIGADDVAVDFPRLKIVLAHAGRPLYTATAIFLARRHPNLFLDLSGIPPRKLLEYLPRLEEISEKCLWGTDWPSPGVRSMKANVDDFVSLPLSAEAKTRILWDNGAKLIG